VAGNVARGDSRLFRFPERDKQRPVLVLTRDSITDRLSRITVAPVNSTIRRVASARMMGRKTRTGRVPPGSDATGDGHAPQRDRGRAQIAPS
jgi:mRNA-degrading endonuclease toxin of MazEF toxin-antitoxin module